MRIDFQTRKSENDWQRVRNIITRRLKTLNSSVGKKEKQIGTTSQEKFKILKIIDSDFKFYFSVYFKLFTVKIYNFHMFHVSIFMSQETFVRFKGTVYKDKIQNVYYIYLNQSKLIRFAELYKVFKS